MKKISVAIATYNGKKYIEEQLMSIINQSVRPDEIIICDDKSNDGTDRLINNLIKNFKTINIKLIINEKNIGYTNNFANAMKLCSGDVIFLSDQDDIWHNSKIEDYLRAFENKEICLLAGAKKYVNENFHISDIRNKPTYSVEKIKKISFENALTRASYNGCVLAIDKTKINNVIFEKLINYLYLDVVDTHDKFLVYYFAGIDKFYLLDEVYTYYRLHGDNLAGSNNTFKPRGDYKRRVLQANLDVEYLRFFKSVVDNEKLEINSMYKDTVNKILNYRIERLDMLEKRSFVKFIKLINNIKWNSNSKVAFGDFYYLFKR